MIPANTTGRLRTPRRYSRRLRRVMYMSALTAIRCDPTSRAYYQRKRDQGKRPVQATICLARRRTDVLYALIRDNRTWHPDSPPNAAADTIIWEPLLSAWLWVL